MIQNTLFRNLRNITTVILAASALPCAWSQTTSKPNVYIQHNLVSDIPGRADVTDPNLVNPWGVSISAGSPFWVSNHEKGNTTLYNGSGTITPLVVTIPSGAKGPAISLPTGQVANTSTSFVLANGRPASFIFATEDGAISAWNTGAAAQLMVDNSAAGAVYKGLAINPVGANPMLYAPNFNSGQIDVFDGRFAPITVPGGFTDSAIPGDFAPFNIWNLNGSLYVLYAKQDAAKKDDVGGPGNGFVSVFDFNGNLIKHLISNGPLNSPWGVAIAPPNFGAFGGALLVGNFGNGRINAFDLNTGNSLGAMQDQNGQAIVIPGLWAILFGNGASGGDRNTLYFAAEIFGPGSEIHGLFGSLAPPAAVLGLTNGASEVSGPVAPGEVVVISGLTIGPSPRAAAPLPATGALGTTLAATTVTFNGTAAPILYASASSTSVLVPYEVAGLTTANVVVTYKDQTTAAFAVPVAASAPGLFTLDFTGSGALVALNSDGTLNGPNNPAAKGSVVLLFATGEGQTNPPGQNGVVTGRFLRTPVLTPSLSIGSLPAQIVYAGSQPAQIVGVMQIEAIVPAAAASGAVPVVLTVGSASSQPGVTLSVR